VLGAGECAVNPLRRRPDGWRTIKVGQLELWWTTSEPRVAAQLATMQTAYSVTLTVVRSDGSGQKLVATLRGTRPLAMRDQPIAVEPAQVKRVVEQAAPRGAWPTGTSTWKLELDV